MSKVCYAPTIGGVMYAMVCTRLDVAHAIGVVSRYKSRLGKVVLGSSQVDSKVFKKFIR